MKSFLLSVFIVLASLAFGQAPEMINYQGVARNSVGNVLPNKKLAMRLSIREGGTSGTIVYKETRTVTTNNFGLFTIAIGSPGASDVSGTINGIDWSTAAKFIQVEIDPEGGSNFINMGASQLLSVPYALYAGTAGTGTLNGTAGGDLSGTYPNPIVKDGAVTSNKLANNSVTTAKIDDASVTSSKLAAGVIPTSLPPNGAANGDLTGTYPNPLIKNGVVTNSKLADNSITTSKVVDGSITLAKLGPDVILGSGGNPTGPAGGDLSGTYPNPLINNDAITSTKLANNSVTTSKIVDASVTSAKLAAGVIPTSLPPNGTASGDLSGTYPNPSVNRIQGVNVTTTGATNGQVLKYNGTAWVPATDDTGSGGSNPIGPAGGDLSGIYPNPTIGSGVITTTKLADNSVTTSKIVDASVTSSKLAAGVIPTSLPPNGTASGDLSGTYPNPLVSKIQNVAVSNIVPVNGQVLKFNGTQWVPATDNVGSGGGGNPTGQAGGDLSGTYPDPNIASGAITTPKIANGAVITPKLADGAVNSNKLADLSVTTSKIVDGSVTSVKLAAGIIPTSLPPNGAASGDLSGSYPNPLVSKIQNVAISNTLPTNGQVLKFNGTQWVPGADNASAFTIPYASSTSNAANLISLANSGTGSGLEGINSSTNANTFGVTGRITSASSGAFSAGLRGINSNTSTNGYGVWGTHSGLGAGVYGNSQSGNGLHGFSVSGNGVFGTSTNYTAGYFDIASVSNTSDALFSYTVGIGSGATAISENGNGLWGITYSATAAGVLGYNTGGGEAIVGRNISSTSGAVVGRNDGVYAGVQGIAGADNGIGVLAQANVDGTVNSNALVASVEGTGNGNPAVFKANGANVARIDKTGKGFFNGGTQNSGADIAEAFDVDGNLNQYEPGDVLVISTNKDRAVERSSQPYSTLVAGVYATKPGVLLTEENIDTDINDKVPMGIIGVIPTKVCLQGGTIKRGDLLVTSSIPGVAMKADLDKVKVGQVIGKALQDYNENNIGKINVLVSIK